MGPGAAHQAVILAAGRGARMGDATERVPKALLPIGPRSLSDATVTCFLRRNIELLQRAGVAPVVVVAGYLGDAIAAELQRWGRGVQVVTNPRARDMTSPGSSGSLDSLQCAVQQVPELLDGVKSTLMMDADVVFHRDALRLFLEAPSRTALLVCSTHKEDDEEVLVFGDPERPHFIGKGLSGDLLAGAACIGEATGILKYAPQDHALVRATIDWFVGDPDAPCGDPRRTGFGPARRATEHEELTQRLMCLERVRCVVFDQTLPFMEVDDAEEYRLLREQLYPRLLRQEADEGAE